MAADFRISEGDILSAIVKKMTDGGFSVVADDVHEGFKRPAAFLAVFPAEVTRLGYLERVRDSVVIDYYPKGGTRVACMKAAEKIRELFLYNSLAVGGRILHVETIKFAFSSYSTNGNSYFMLMCDFDYEYEQNTGIEDDDGADETMEHLDLVID